MCCSFGVVCCLVYVVVCCALCQLLDGVLPVVHWLQCVGLCCLLCFGYCLSFVVFVVRRRVFAVCCPVFVVWVLRVVHC